MIEPDDIVDRVIESCNLQTPLSVKERNAQALELYESVQDLPWTHHVLILTQGRGFASGSTEKWTDDFPENLPAHETRSCMATGIFTVLDAMDMLARPHPPAVDQPELGRKNPAKRTSGWVNACQYRYQGPRAKEDIACVGAALLDLDGITPEEYERFTRLLDGFGFVYQVMTTFSHGLTDDGLWRFRVFIPYLCMVDQATHFKFVNWLDHYFDKPSWLDPSQFDPSQPAYLFPDTQADRFWYDRRDKSGTLLSVEAFLQFHKPPPRDSWRRLPLTSKTQRRRRTATGDFERGLSDKEQFKIWNKCSEDKQQFLLDLGFRRLGVTGSRWEELQDEGGHGRFGQVVGALRICNELGIPLAVWIEAVLASDWNKKQPFPLTADYIGSRNLATILDTCRRPFGEQGKHLWLQRFAKRKNARSARTSCNWLISNKFLKEGLDSKTSREKRPPRRQLRQLRLLEELAQEVERLIPGLGESWKADWTDDSIDELETMRDHLEDGIIYTRSADFEWLLQAGPGNPSIGIFDASPTGSGKSTRGRRIMKKNPSGQWVCPPRALVANTVQQARDEGISCQSYQEVKGKWSGWVVTTPNSAFKDRRRPVCTIEDELPTSLAALTNMGEMTPEAWRRMANAAAFSNTYYAMGADFDPISYRILVQEANRLREEEGLEPRTFVVVLPDAEPLDREILIAPLNTAREEILEYIQEMGTDERVVILCTTVQEVKTLSEVVTGMREDLAVGVYHGALGGPAKERAQRDFNRFVEDMHVVISTHAMGLGVNIDRPAVDRLAVLHSNDKVVGDTLMQSISRVRHNLKTSQVLVGVTFFSQRSIETDQTQLLCNRLAQEVGHEKKLKAAPDIAYQGAFQLIRLTKRDPHSECEDPFEFDDECGLYELDWEAVDPSQINLLYMWAYQVSKQAVAESDPLWSLTRACEDVGWPVRFVDSWDEQREDKEKRDKPPQAYKQAAARVKQTEIVAIASAEKINSRIRDEYRRTYRSPDAEMQAAIKRHDIEDFHERSLDPLMETWKILASAGEFDRLRSRTQLDHIRRKAADAARGRSFPFQSEYMTAQEIADLIDADKNGKLRLRYIQGAYLKLYRDHEDNRDRLRLLEYEFKRKKGGGFRRVKSAYAFWHAAQAVTKLIETLGITEVGWTMTADEIVERAGPVFDEHEELFRAAQCRWKLPTSDQGIVSSFHTWMRRAGASISYDKNDKISRGRMEPMHPSALRWINIEVQRREQVLQHADEETRRILRRSLRDLDTEPEREQASHQRGEATSFPTDRVHQPPADAAEALPLGDESRQDGGAAVGDQRVSVETVECGLTSNGGTTS